MNDFSTRLMVLIAGLFLLISAGPRAACADTVTLANGYRLQIERQESQGSILRLYIVGGGYVDVAPDTVASCEKDDVRPPVQSPASEPDLATLLKTAGAQHGLDPVFLKSMVAAESSFHPMAVSPKGAAGLMQIMPSTAGLLGLADPFNASQNLQAGAQYIRSLLERYRGDVAKALAAYNAGPAAVDRYRGIPPYAETQQYVRRVIERFNQEKKKTTDRR